MIIIFLGAPGSGKGTISSVLKEEHGFKHISTGEAFREITKSDTELGRRVKHTIEGGNLVDDQTTWEVCKTILEKYDLQNDNVILDGYPRNVKQAETIDEYVSTNNIDTKVIFYDVSQEEILKRLGGRLMCSKCGKTYHKINKPPKVEGICDSCGAELITREDDKPENIKVRLVTYDKVTKPVIDYYEGKVITINAEDGVTSATEQTIKAIK